MFKLILIVGFAAFALFWIAAPPSAPSTEALQADGGGNLTAPQALATSQAQAIVRRREIFFGMVAEVKKDLLAGSTERERNLFDLAPNHRRWEVLRSYLVERGSPDGSELLSSLAVGSLDDIEFGTLDGSVGCSIPDEVGFVIRQPAR
jgi:hypothetical protein